ncbi:hypothetical protein SO802_021274 [Lithocarpus litseifolius]|uniref:Uncharacterized protein n=1 Tax=Lithocarpus litseifolius TaxID=425828 RepID=A0AAW2CGJ6_9ROSI
MCWFLFWGFLRIEDKAFGPYLKEILKWASNNMCYRDYCFALERPIVHKWLTCLVSLIWDSCVSRENLWNVNVSHTNTSHNNGRIFIYWFLYAEEMKDWAIGKLAANWPGQTKMFYIIIR